MRIDEVSLDDTQMDQLLTQFETEMKSRLGLQQFTLYMSFGDIKLSSLIIARGNQKQGVGTAAMEALIKLADQYGRRIVLSPARKDDHFGTTSQSRLFRFYRRFGFRPNKGRYKDYRVSDLMIRPARKPVREGRGQALRTQMKKGNLNLYLFSRGWSKVGSGFFSEVYKHPKLDYVLKVAERGDRCYLAYLSLIIKNQGNPHVPKLLDRNAITWKEFPHFFAVRMEKLAPYTPDSDLIKASSITVKAVAMMHGFGLNLTDAIARSIMSPDPHHPAKRDEPIKSKEVVNNAHKRMLEIEQKMPAYYNLLVQIGQRILSKEEDWCGSDIRDVNIMTRPGTGDIVITDPMFD